MNNAPRSAASAPAAPLGGWSGKKGWVWLAVIVALFFGSFAVYPRLFVILGLNHYGIWFLDTFAVLASNDAVTRGLNPYDPNPLDYFNRPHVYSHWWLHLRDLGLTRADVGWLSVTVIVSFLIVACWRLRARTPGQLAWYAAILCSSPVLLGVDRCNNDLVIFMLLAPVVPSLLSERRWMRWVAPILITVAMLLKYYPAVAGLVVLAGTNRKEVRLRLLVTLLLLVAAGSNIANDLAQYGPIAPRPAGLMSFGASGVLAEFGRMGWAPKVFGAAFGGVIALDSWYRRQLGSWEPPAAQQSSWLHFILGAALLTACFFTAMNYWYRLIFAIWLAPLLWDLVHGLDAPAVVRWYAKHVTWLLLFLFWWPLVWMFILNQLAGVVSLKVLGGIARVTFLIEQPFDWLFYFCLVVFLTQFARLRFAFLVGKPA